MSLPIKTKEQALAVLARLDELRSANEMAAAKVQAITFGSEKFPQQLAFINDNSPLGSALCPRRAGKSYAVGLKMYKKAYDFPGSTILYISLTKESAKRIMWRDVILEIARQYGIEIVERQSVLEIDLPNGSLLKLAGADSSQKEKDKFLGGKYPYVCIDEAGSFTQNLADMIYEFLEPAVADFEGCIDIVGTPTVFWQGFFCKVTEGREPGWTNHAWDTLDNPYMKDKWRKRIDLLKERDPRVEETPRFLRMYKAIWVKDMDNLIYKFQADRNLIDELPKGEIDGQVLGMDLGYNDATAYVLSRYYFHDENLYFIKSFKKEGQIIDDVVKTMREFIKDYDIHTVVIDNASKQVVETLKVRFALYDVTIHSADKRDKMEYIGFMNSDFILGKIKLLKDATEDYQEELGNLIKDPNNLKTVEHPSCENHLCDSGLYNWRFARNYTAQPMLLPAHPEDVIEDQVAHRINMDGRTDEEKYYEGGDWGNDFEDGFGNV